MPAPLVLNFEWCLISVIYGKQQQNTIHDYEGRMEWTPEGALWLLLFFSLCEFHLLNLQNSLSMKASFLVR